MFPGKIARTGGAASPGNARKGWDIRHSHRDIVALYSARSLRLFAYGALSVVLALYLQETGFSAKAIGFLFTLTLAGDAVVSLGITSVADRLGRRRMLMVGAVLMAAAGAVFSLTGDPFLLIVAGVVGVISPSGNEIGPFLSLEQAALSQLLPQEKRTNAFAWYTLAGSLATAIGSLAGGIISRSMLHKGWSELASYRAVILLYAFCGFALLLLFRFLSPDVEAQNAVRKPRVLGLHRSRGVVMQLSALFSLDAFAGGFVIQSMVAYWFHVRFGLDAGFLGGIFFGANILAGASSLLAARIAARIGLINTMVFTHIPSNLLLCLVPFMPGPGWAVAVLLLRFSISQMDVPTRQSYTMAVVEPDERAAAAGVTNIARSVGAALSPSLAGLLMAVPALLATPFLVAGGLKIAYDLLLYRSFRYRDQQ